ncbi:MAG: adenylosuccinate lyase, partial [Desulfomonilaceae bacterium]
MTTLINRYSRKQMTDIWEPANKFQKWLDIELAVCEAWAKRGVVPQASMERIRKKASFSIDRINEIEKTTRHDVIAFTTSVAEFLGEDSRFIHRGLTSYDVVDTALSLLMKQAGSLIRDGVIKLMEGIKERAFEAKKIPIVGRSHGIHAEPTTFGLKLAIFYSEMSRNLTRWDAALETISVGKISGAVGTYAHLDPEMEAEILASLGLKPAPASNQIIQRDRHAEYCNVLALIASTIEKIATEIRHLQRSEVSEVEEFFHEGQKGSSAMPHKRNPVLTENLCGLARVVRGYSLSAMENIPLWHERDISHSSVERIVVPDSTIVVDFMLSRMSAVIKNMRIFQDHMAKNLDSSKGLIFSESILIKLVDKGMTRERAYLLTQRNAMKAWENNLNFKDVLLEDVELTQTLTQAEIES